MYRTTRESHREISWAGGEPASRTWRLAILLFLAAIPCAAGTLTFGFTGQVTDDAINGCGVLVNCGVVTGSYTFDPLAPDLNPGQTNAGLYAATNISFAIDGVPFFSAPTGFITIADFGLEDQYGVLALSGVAANGSSADLSILLIDPSATAFSSDAVVPDPAALAALLPGAFTLFAGDDSFQLQGTIDSISATAVPEPAMFAPLAIGLTILLARRRYRSNSAMTASVNSDVDALPPTSPVSRCPAA